jgi:putative transposase
MDLPRRDRLPHEVPPWVPESSFFFITINCQPRGRNQLCRAGIGDAVLAAAAYYHTHLKWHCRLMLLMPDHLHAIIAFPAGPGIKATVRFWKRYLSRLHRVQWQRDFFDHRLRDHHQQVTKAEYILQNPVRWGLCERVEEWPWVYHPADRLPPRLGG